MTEIPGVGPIHKDEAMLLAALHQYVVEEIDDALASMWAMILNDAVPGEESQTVDEVAGKMLEYYGNKTEED